MQSAQKPEELTKDSDSLDGVIYRGEIYKLAIIKDTSFGTWYKLAYVNMDTDLYLDSFYSGGATGVGHKKRSSFSADVTFIRFYDEEDKE